MKKLGLAALVALPFVGGCYAYVPARPYYYSRPYYRPYYRPVSRVYVAPPAPVVVTPPRVYW